MLGVDKYVNVARADKGLEELVKDKENERNASKNRKSGFVERYY